MKTTKSSQQAAVRNEKGFSLIELMIVVTIVGILAAITIPAYNKNIEKTRRIGAASNLLQFANAMERHYSEQTPFTYAGATAGTATTDTFTNQSPKTGVAFYTLSVASTANTYTLTATPTSAQGSDGCGNLTLTNAGVKGVSSSTVTECW